jgi:hypothetical protein
MMLMMQRASLRPSSLDTARDARQHGSMMRAKWRGERLHSAAKSPCGHRTQT